MSEISSVQNPKCSASVKFASKNRSLVFNNLQTHITMKVLVVMFVFCIAGTLGGLTDTQRVKLRTYKENCIAESGVDPAVVENAKKGEIAQDDTKLQCFAACLLRHIGILDAEGVFHEDVVRAKIPADIPSEKADAVITRCKSLVGSNLCQTGGAIFTCFLKTKSFNLL